MSTVLLPRPVLLLRVAAAAGLGCLAAVIVVAVRRTIEHPRLVDGTAVGITVLWVLAILIVVADADATQPAVPAQWSPRPIPPAPPPALGPPPPVPLRTDGPSSMHPTAGPSWYEAAARGIAGQSTPAPASTPPRQVPGPAQTLPSTPPDHVALRLGPAVDGRGDVTQLVQCPRCGAFEIDGHRVRQGCTFACGGCGHQWHLRPDDPWPVTIVRPRLQRFRSEEPGSGARPVWRMDS